MRQHRVSAGIAGRAARGFTLTELLIVVAIIGIIAAIAYPSYQRNVRESNRSEAHVALTTLAARLERFFSDNNRYTTSLTTADADPDLGYVSANTEHGYYSLAIAAGPCGNINACYTLTATAQGNQTADTTCPAITLDSTGAKGPTGCWR